MRAFWHALHSDLLHIANRRRSHDHFQTIQHRHFELAAFPDIPALLDALHRSNKTAVAKAAILRALVIAAQDPGEIRETAQSILVLALWPGLDAIYWRNLRFFRDDPGLLVSEISARVAIGIATLDLARVNRIAATLLRNVERDLRRKLQSDWARSNAEVEAAGDDAILRPDAQERGVPPEKALDALRKVIGRDASLVTAVVLLGVSQREAALWLGLSHEATRKRYQRAIRQLTDHAA